MSHPFICTFTRYKIIIWAPLCYFPFIHVAFILGCVNCFKLQRFKVFSNFHTEFRNNIIETTECVYPLWDYPALPCYKALNLEVKCGNVQFS